MKLVYLIQWKDDPFVTLRAQHPDMTFVHASSEVQAIGELADADILVVGGPFYAGDLAVAVNNAAPKLRWIQSISIGLDQFEKGGVPADVLFTNAAGLKGGTVAEHAMAMLLGYLHGIPQMDRFKAANHWGRAELRDEISGLDGTTLLVLGYGSIGQEVGRKARAFDAHVIGINRCGQDAPHADEIHPITELETYLPKADVVVCTLPLADDTNGMIGKAAFAAMKSSALFVNVGRGAVVDHDALKQALIDGQIAGACLDVFNQEPLPSDDALWSLPNVLISPHIAGNGGQMVPRFMALVGENIQRLKDGRDLINLQRVGTLAAE